MAPRPWKILEATQRAMAVSYGVIAAIVVFVAIGYLLDRALNTSPWLLFAGLAIGLSIGFYALVSLIRQRS
jgi:F0F1-type ATP synthase assembly protein I